MDSNKPYRQPKVEHPSPTNHTPDMVFARDFHQVGNCVAARFPEGGAIHCLVKHPLDQLQIAFCDAATSISYAFFVHTIPFYRLDFDPSGAFKLDFHIWGQFALKLRSVRVILEGSIQADPKKFQDELAPTLGLRTLSMLKRTLRRQYERIYKVVYYDGELNGIQFDAVIRQKFKIDQQTVRMALQSMRRQNLSIAQAQSQFGVVPLPPAATGAEEGNNNNNNNNR